MIFKFPSDKNIKKWLKINDMTRDEVINNIETNNYDYLQKVLKNRCDCYGFIGEGNTKILKYYNCGCKMPPLKLLSKYVDYTAIDNLLNNLSELNPISISNICTFWLRIVKYTPNNVCKLNNIISNVYPFADKNKIFLKEFTRIIVCYPDIFSEFIKSSSINYTLIAPYIKNASRKIEEIISYYNCDINKLRRYAFCKKPRFNMDMINKIRMDCYETHNSDILVDINNDIIQEIIRNKENEVFIIDIILSLLNLTNHRNEKLDKIIKILLNECSLDVIKVIFGKLSIKYESWLEYIIDNWNIKVKNKHIAYYVGDVCWYCNANYENNIRILKKMINNSNFNIIRVANILNTTMRFANYTLSEVLLSNNLIQLDYDSIRIISTGIIIKDIERFGFEYNETLFNIFYELEPIEDYYYKTNFIPKEYAKLWYMVAVEKHTINMYRNKSELCVQIKEYYDNNMIHGYFIQMVYDAGINIENYTTNYMYQKIYNRNYSLLMKTYNISKVNEVL